MRRVTLVLFLLATLAGCGGPAPTRTPASAFDRWRAAGVLDAFAAAGLAVNNRRDNPASAMGDAPRVWADDLSFDGAGGLRGHVQTFPTPVTWGRVLDWHGKRFVAGIDPLPYIYTRDNVILEIDGYVSKAEADRYKAALDAMK